MIELVYAEFKPWHQSVHEAKQKGDVCSLSFCHVLYIFNWGSFTAFDYICLNSRCKMSPEIVCIYSPYPDSVWKSSKDLTDRWNLRGIIYETFSTNSITTFKIRALYYMRKVDLSLKVTLLHASLGQVVTYLKSYKCIKKIMNYNIWFGFECFDMFEFYLWQFSQR